MKIFKREDLSNDIKTYKTLLGDAPFNGISYWDSNLDYYENGFTVFVKSYDNNKPLDMSFWYEESTQVGYQFLFSEDESNELCLKKILFWDFNIVIEHFIIDSKGQIERYGNINDKSNEIVKLNWLNYRNSFSDPNMFDFLPFYNQQNELKEKVISQDELPNEIKYIAGVDVAYNELEQRLVAGIVILDAQTFQIVEEASHEEKLSFPHVPGLLPFIEVPHVIAAFKKLSIKPDLIVCDGYGINHPKGVGIATHLGIELDTPTIACAQKRLVGYYDAPEPTRFSNTSLQFANKEVGKALRTQDNIEPVFVSVGHKISIETACDWVLKLTQNNRLPQTTLAANTLTSKFVKERTDWDTPLDFYLKKMKEQSDEV